MKLRPEDRLYLIAESEGARWPVEQAIHEAVRAGVRLVQLREKALPDDDYAVLAARVRRITAEYGARLLINSRLHVARDVGADGVHLPRNASISEARAVCGPAALIGVSAHAEAELRRAESASADFVTLSPVYPSLSKAGYDAALGPKHFAELVRDACVPVYALGGVDVANVGMCRSTGAYGVAVVGSVMAADDIGGAVRALLDALS